MARDFDTITLPVIKEQDIVQVRKKVRDACRDLGFGLTDVTRIVTAASELARNIYRYADTGVVRIEAVSKAAKRGVQIVFEDKGPGIADVDQAMQEGYTTERSMGMGLPGAKKLMDEMTIDSTVGVGTTITIVKWTR